MNITDSDNEEIFKRIQAMSTAAGLPASLFEDIAIKQYAAYTTADYAKEMQSYSYQPPEPKKIYLGMYVYVEKWPEIPVFEQSRTRVCINIQCPEYLVETGFLYNESCDTCGQKRRHFAVEVKRSANIDTLINNILGKKVFTALWARDGIPSEVSTRVIVPQPEYAFELGGTIIEDNLTSLKGIIDALKRSEKVHEYWYVLCASLQRHEAKFQPGRGLVIIN